MSSYFDEHGIAATRSVAASASAAATTANTRRPAGNTSSGRHTSAEFYALLMATVAGTASRDAIDASPWEHLLLDVAMRQSAHGPMRERPASDEFILNLETANVLEVYATDATACCYICQEAYVTEASINNGAMRLSDSVDDDQGDSVASSRVPRKLIKRLPCGHMFDADCIIPWLQSNTCPVCRKEFPRKSDPVAPVLPAIASVATVAGDDAEEPWDSMYM